jgi:conjugative transposon TraN protein
MKWYYVIILFSFNSVKAQSLRRFSDSSYIRSYSLEVTDNKTTNLIFPSAIKSVDRGSKDILAQKAGGVENILKVKADVKSFPETNLSVITTDGKLYSFVVGYNPQPSYQSINIETSPVIYSVPEVNKPELAEYCLGITDSPSNVHSLADTHAKVSIALNALYNKEDVLFFRLAFHNRSALNYDIDQFRFYIRDYQKAKRTATQEVEIKPLYISGDTATIKGHTYATWVIALSKFTIPDDKFLAIEIMEKNGGRSLFLKVKNRHIMKTETLQ